MAIAKPVQLLFFNRKILSLLFASFCMLPVFALYTNGLEWPKDISVFLIKEALSNSALLLVLVVIGGSLLGGGSAFLLFLSKPFGRSVLVPFLLGPLVFPSYVLGFLFMSAFPSSQFWQSSSLALAFILAVGFSPYSFLFTLLGLRSLQESHWEAHTLSGREFSFLLRKVVWPRVLPFWLAGTLLIAFETLSEFGAASLFNVTVLTTLIYRVWFDYFSFQGALGLVGFFGILVFFFIGVEKMVPQIDLNTKNSSPWDPGCLPVPWVVRLTSSLFLWLFAIVGTCFPLGVLFSWIPEGLKEEKVTQILESLVGTLGLAFAGSLVTLVLGLLFAHLFLEYKGKNKLRNETLGSNSQKNSQQNPWLFSLSVLGYAFPGVFLALGWVTVGYVLFSEMTTVVGLVLLCLAFSHKFLNVAQRSLAPSLESIPSQWSEYHQLTGLKQSRLWQRVYWPKLKPAMLYTFLLIAIEIAKEMPLTLTLLPSQISALSVQVFNLTSEGEWAKASLYSVALVFVGFVSLIISVKMMGVDTNEKNKNPRKWRWNVFS